MVLDIFALVVMLVLIGAVIGLVVFLGPLPGNIAKERSHPQADAIRVLGWIGVITFGASWLVALVWAYIRPGSLLPQDRQLPERISALEEQVRQLTAGGKES